MQELPEELLRHSLLLFADDEQSPPDCAVVIEGETAGEDSGSIAAAEISPADAGLPLEQPCHLTSHQLVKREIAAYLDLRQELAERLRRAPRTKKKNPLSDGQRAAAHCQNVTAAPKTTKESQPKQRREAPPASQASPMRKSEECLALPLEAPPAEARHCLRNSLNAAPESRPASLKPRAAGLSQPDRKQQPPKVGASANSAALSERQRHNSGTSVVPAKKAMPLMSAKQARPVSLLEQREAHPVTFQQRSKSRPAAQGFAPFSIERDEERRFSMQVITRRGKSSKSGTMEI